MIGRGQSPDPRPVGDSLERVARSLGAAGAAPVFEVFSSWDDVVGPLVAAHCYPISLANSVLVVGVDSPAWATQVKFLSADLLGRLAELAGQAVAERVDIRVRPPRR